MKLKEIKGDLKQALELVWRVFLEYEAPFYTKQGIDTFHSFISDIDKMNLLTFYGMYDKNKLIGVIATRNNGNHIALFFENVLDDCKRQVPGTVTSSPGRRRDA